MEQARLNMVQQQLIPCDIHDKHLINLLFKIKRDKFTPAEYSALAYADLAIPLYANQSMLCPRVETILLQSLAVNKADKVLEIGTGSAYVTALLAKLADFVYSVEINTDIQQLATQNLARESINNVSVLTGDGITAATHLAPFNKIFVGGALVTIPATLKNQLTIGGSLVALVGIRPILHAVHLQRTSATEFSETKLFETDAPYLISATNDAQLQTHIFNW